MAWPALLVMTQLHLHKMTEQIGLLFNESNKSSKQKYVLLGKTISFTEFKSNP